MPSKARRKNSSAKSRSLGIRRDTAQDNPRIIKQMQAEVLREHAAFLDSAKSTVLHAITAGRILLAIKELVGHGRWLDWIQANFSQTTGLTERTAQRYMTTAKKHRDLLESLNSSHEAQGKTALESSGTTLGDMTLNDALRHIAARTDETKSRHEASPIKSVRTNEWLTPPHVVEAAVKCLGTIDLDPAAATGVDNIPAKQRLTRKDDALDPSVVWTGKAFISPGFQGNLSPWVSKTLASFDTQQLDEAVLFLPALTDSPWAHQLAPFPRAFVAQSCTVDLVDQHTKGKLTKPSLVVYLAPREQFTRFADAFRSFTDVFLPFDSSHHKNGE